MNAPKKVLAVDDESFILVLIQMALEAESIKVVTAGNGREALETAARENPDLILLDLNMPVMDGYQALEKLKADEKTRQIPVLIVSAFADGKNIQRCRQLGATDFISKPFKVAELPGIVKRHLNLA